MKKPILRIALIRNENLRFGVYAFFNEGGHRAFGTDMLQGRGTKDADVSWRKMLANPPFDLGRFEVKRFRLAELDWSLTWSGPMTTYGRRANTYAGSEVKHFTTEDRNA
jgi:hypothetical protein